jgi:hypothetical protein
VNSKLSTDLSLRPSMRADVTGIGAAIHVL